MDSPVPSTSASVKRVLLTGAAGFLGSHCLRHLLANTDWEIICPVSFQHRGLPERLSFAVEQDEWWHRIKIVKCDLSCPINDTTRASIGPIDYIINYAAESHVNRSIVDPVPFIKNNVDIILNVLEFARVAKPEIVMHISTDEVYGSAPDGYAHPEWDPILPSSPYSASKAAQEAIAISYWRTYDVPVAMVNCFDMQTRVLTDDGLKYHKDLSIGDNVWVLNDQGEMALEPVLGLMRKRGPSEMVRISARGSSQLVTPEHRVMVQRSHGSPRSYGPVEATPAESLLGLKGRVQIPRTGSWIGFESPTIRPYEHFSPAPGRRGQKRIPDEVPTEWAAELFGWFLAEGNIINTQVRITQKSNLVRDHIAELLHEVDGTVGTQPGVAYVSNGHLADFLGLCGGRSQTTYRIPRFLLDLSPKYLKILFDAMMDGDGTRYGGGCVYYTKSYGLAIDVCELGMKLGYSARISERETWNPNKTQRSRSWITRLTKAQGSVESRNVTLQPYDGDVWCLHVPSGRVFVERDGIISLSGQCMNLIGQTQDPEKYVSMIINKVLRGDKLIVHVAPDGRIGSRFYLHAGVLADAVLFLMHRGNVAVRNNDNARPDRWNVVGDQELDNLELAQLIAKQLDRELIYELQDFNIERPGHDRRYALDGSKLAQAGWTAPMTFEESLRELVSWALANPFWTNRA
jgi:dTDP-D-glucose 4,6-dehydratase